MNRLIGDSEGPWKIMAGEMLRPDYIARKIAILLLCIMHSYVRQRTLSSLVDLFCWPEGLCLDMLVVAMFFTIGLMSVLDDVGILTKAAAVTWRECNKLLMDMIHGIAGR